MEEVSKREEQKMAYDVRIDEYFATRMNSEGWVLADIAIKEISVVDAMRRISVVVLPSYLEEDPIHDMIIWAQAELALALIEDEESELGIESYEYESLKIKYSHRSEEHMVNGIISRLAWQYLLPFIDNDNKSINLRRIN